MAGTPISRATKRRLSAFAHQLANPFTDSRRRRFLTDMITGLVIGGHVHLSKIARATSRGTEDIKSQEKRLSRHLGSEHWDMSPLAETLLTDAAARVSDAT